MKKLKIDVVIPVYNNAHELEASIDKLHGFLSKSCMHDWKIIIANNASKDNTLALAKELSKKYDRVGYTHTDIQGRGNALSETWLSSGADIHTYMDVDLSTNLESFERLIDPIIEGKADITTGSRYVPRSRIKRVPTRYVLSKAYNTMTRVYLRAKFKDAQCGFKAMSDSSAKAILPKVKDGFWFWDTEMMYIAQKLGFRVKEVPIKWVEDPDSGVKIVKTVTSFLKKLHELKKRKIR